MKLCLSTRQAEGGGEMEIVRTQLTSDVLYSKNLRYYSAGDVVQYTNDGGTTWVDAPGQDPRIVAQVPPPDTADPACDGAERITEHYQALVAAFITGAAGGATSVVTAFLLLLFPAFALLIIVINLVVNGLLSIGAEDVADAFLGDEWETFKCIVRNKIGADGFVTEAGFSEIRDAVNFQIGGNAATVLNYLMDMTGFGGMNDAAGQRTETGDCSECADTWCRVFYPDTTMFPSWTLAVGTVDGNEIVGVQDGLPYRISLTTTLLADVALTGCDFYGATGAARNVYLVNEDTVSVIWEATNEEITAGRVRRSNVIPAGTHLRLECGQNPPTPFHLTLTVLGGEGDNPYGANNC